MQKKSQPIREEIERVEEEKNVVFKPNEGPQTEFLAANEREVLYGGSAGGGKTYSMLVDPLRYMGHSEFSGLLLRRTTEELRELIFKSQELYPKIWKGIKWSERKMQWTAPFSWIGFDELTQWSTPYAWNYMRSRLRSTASNLPIFMRATTNPGGRGHAWVKKMFIAPAPFGKAFDATDIDTGETLKYPAGHERAGKPLFKRRFIPARLSDNPYLAENGDYEAMLLSLPEQQRRQLLEGDWDIKEGAAFTEFNRDVHVIEPFNIPSNWVKFRSCDYGYGSYSGVLWFAVSPAEQLVVYRELYVSKVLATDLADQILELEAGDGNIKYGVLDSSLWHKRGDLGPSLAEQMITRGCRWRPSDRSRGSRVAGKTQLPSLPLDKKNPEDVDTNAEDHLYDALRYGLQSRPKFSIFDYDPANKPSMGMRVADEKFGY